MSVSVTMPRLGESVTEGTVTRWLKKEGDQVTADEPLLEVSTDKVDTEIPAPASGVLQSIKVAEDETVEVGAELAVIGDAAAAPAEDAAPAEPAAEPAAPAAAQPEPAAAAVQPEPAAVAAQPEPAAAAAQPEPAAAAAEPEPEPALQPEPTQTAQPVQAAAQPTGQDAQPNQQQAADGSGDDDDPDSSDGGPAYVTPLVRRLASEHGVDLSALRGTGLGGRVRKQDVLDAAGSSNGSPAQTPAQSSPAQSSPAQTSPAQSSPPQAPAAQPAAAAQAAPAAQELVTSSPAPQRTAPAAAPTAAGVTAVAASATLKGRTEKLSRLRQVIARRMVESLQTSAQLTTVVEVDVTKIARLRQQAKAAFEAREGAKLSFLPFFAVAAIEALKLHPVVNSSIDLDAAP
jgi:2-oxoglutarate dehydrogenase E2 component (dihydrolipoamide succinyltransferase)